MFFLTITFPSQNNLKVQVLLERLLASSWTPQSVANHILCSLRMMVAQLTFLSQLPKHLRIGRTTGTRSIPRKQQLAKE